MTVMTDSFPREEIKTEKVERYVRGLLQTPMAILGGRGVSGY